jgi:DNA-binding protein HU-beta
VNKTDLIESLSGRLGDRKAATTALDAVLAEIQNAVTKGDKVSITGFGVFEKRVRAARTGRNPRTGESVKVKKTSVPAFRPGATFKELVAAGKVPKAAKAAKAAAPAKKTGATPSKTVAASAKTVAVRARKTASAPARPSTTPATPAKATKATKATKAVKTIVAQKPAALAKKVARAAARTTPRSTATVRNVTAKAPARTARTAAK